MFGDKLIIGCSESKIDSTGRLFIPKFSQPEPKDEVILKRVTFEGENALKIISYKKFIEYIAKLENLKNKSETLEEYKELTNKIESIIASIDRNLTIDKQMRIQIPKYTLSELSWQAKDEIVFTGIGDSLLVRKKTTIKNK